MPTDNLDADAALIDALRGEAYVRKSNLIEQAADRLEALTAERDEARALVDPALKEGLEAVRQKQKAEAMLAKVQVRLDTWEVDDSTGEKLVNDLDAILDGNGGDTE